MPHILVLLSGCGHQDGTEIHEAVFSMLALAELGATLEFASLEKAQTKVINHISGKQIDETRNMLVESARIARGKVKHLDEMKIESFDGIVLPGGFGAALNLCNYGIAGREMVVDPIVARWLLAFYEAKKPIGAICIAPVIVAKVLGEFAVKLTIGNDPKVSADILSFGAKHIVCPKGDCVIDDAARIVTTPAYMYGDSTLPEVFAGIRKLASSVIRMAS